MKGIKVDVKQMMVDSKVTTMQGLSDMLYVRDFIEVSTRTLHHWQAGHHLCIAKFVKVAEALGYDNPLELLSYDEIKRRR